jgi:hypothetical protein
MPVTIDAPQVEPRRVASLLLSARVEDGVSRIGATWRPQRGSAGYVLESDPTPALASSLTRPSVVRAPSVLVYATDQRSILGLNPQEQERDTLAWLDAVESMQEESWLWGDPANPLRLARAVIVAPAVAAPTTATTGGTLAPGTYSYRVSTVTLDGTSDASAAVTITIAGGTGSTTTNTVTVTWAAVTGATAYRVYGRVGGSEGLLAEVTDLDYTDTGADAVGAAVPAGARDIPATQVLGTGAVEPRAALATLEDWLSTNLPGRRGMLHATVRASVFLPDTRREAVGRGALLLTKFDTLLVAGAGYPGTGPAGEAQATNAAGSVTETWVYATAQPLLRRSIPTVDARTGGLDLASNTSLATASRAIDISHDGPTAAVRMTLTPTP